MFGSQDRGVFAGAGGGDPAGSVADGLAGDPGGADQFADLAVERDVLAAAEHVLDTALALANTSPHGRVTPSFLACLDELPSTAPLPTLRVRMANERALGLSFLYAAQPWRQMVVCYGEDEARSLFGLTNTIIVFGGGKDIAFYREISDLVGTTRVSRQTVNDGPGGVGTSRSSEDTPILRPEQLRMLPERQALVVGENAPPIIAQLRHCIDGRAGRTLLAELSAARERMTAARELVPDADTRAALAVRYSRAHRLHPGTTAQSGPDGEDLFTDRSPASHDRSPAAAADGQLREPGDRP